MIRNSASVPLILALLFGILPDGGHARTEEGLFWSHRSSGGHISLIYGPADPATNPVFLLSCFNDMDIAVLDIFSTIEGTRPGEALTIELSAGSAQSPLKGEASLDDQTGVMFAEASDITVEPVLAVLRTPGPLTVKMGLTSKTLTDAGRADAVEGFSRACKVE